MLMTMCFSLSAQSEQKNENFISKAVKALKKHFDEGVLQGFDTTYIGIPKHPFLGCISANFAGITSTVIGTSVPTYGDVNINMKSSLAAQTKFNLSYQGTSVGYSIDFLHGYNSNFSFSYIDKAWGVEYNRHSTDGVHGTMTSSTKGSSLYVDKGDINVKTTLVTGYVILNNKKFCLSTTMYPAYIQKRSAGSVLLVGGYISSAITTDNTQLIQRLGNIKKIEVTQGTVGIGYGYNYAIDRGKILLHASAIPMLVIHNNNLITLDYTAQLSDGTYYTTEIMKRIDTDKKVFFTGIFRCSASYNIGERYVLRLAGVLNDIRFSSTSGLTVKTRDWYGSAMLGVRF